MKQEGFLSYRTFLTAGCPCFLKQFVAFEVDALLTDLWVVLQFVVQSLPQAEGTLKVIFQLIQS